MSRTILSRRAPAALAVLLLPLAAYAGCDSGRLSPLAPDPALVAAEPAGQTKGTSSAAKELGPETCAFGQAFSLEPGNPYYPLTPGSYWILEGEEDGTPLRVRIDITGDTEVVGGVTTRVLTETEWEDGNEDGAFDPVELVEVSYNYFAGSADGTVCYFGEAVDDYEDGEVISHGGEWRADEPGHWPGVFMPTDPRPGTSYQMEGAPGIAEDRGRIVGIGPITVPAGSFGETIRVREYNPLDEEKGYKVFAAGVGTIVDGPLSLIAYHVEP